jgi:MSHA biogenesis protein MshI
MAWFGGRKQRGNARLALQWRDGGLAYAVQRGGSLTAVGLWPAAEGLQDSARSLVDRHGLHGLATTLVLGGGSYQITQVPTPQAGEHGLPNYGSAVRELLDYPLEQAAVAGFDLPGDAYRGRQKLSYVVSTPKAPLAAMARALVDADLELDRVEVPELAVNALLAREASDGPGVALVFVDGEQSWVSLHQGGNLYLLRSVDLTHEGLARQGAFDHRNMRDSLALELQRSMDFYDSQLGKGVVRRVWLAPGSIWQGEVVDHLDSSLGLPIERLSTARHADSLAGQEGACFVVEAALLAALQRDAAPEQAA